MLFLERFERAIWSSNVRSCSLSCGPIWRQVVAIASTDSSLLLVQGFGEEIGVLCSGGTKWATREEAVHIFVQQW